MLHIRRHLFHEFLFVYLSLSDTDIIMTLVQYFVCCIHRPSIKTVALFIPFSYEEKRVTRID